MIIEVVTKIDNITEISELLAKSFVYKSAGKMPDLLSKNIEHKIEVEKITYLINLIESPKFYILAKDGEKIVGFGIISESNLQYFYDLRLLLNCHRLP